MFASLFFVCIFVEGDIGNLRVAITIWWQSNLFDVSLYYASIYIWVSGFSMGHGCILGQHWIHIYPHNNVVLAENQSQPFQFESISKKCKNKFQIKILHFEWSPPWHHIETYLSQNLTFFVLKSGEDEKERIILMKSRDRRSLDFIRIIRSSSSLLLVRDPAVTTVIYLAKLIQTDSRYAWFKRISDARASRDA